MRHLALRLLVAVCPLGIAACGGSSRSAVHTTPPPNYGPVVTTLKGPPNVPKTNLSAALAPTITRQLQPLLGGHTIQEAFCTRSGVFFNLYECYFSVKGIKAPPLQYRITLTSRHRFTALTAQEAQLLAGHIKGGVAPPKGFTGGTY